MRWSPGSPPAPRGPRRSLSFHVGVPRHRSRTSCPATSSRAHPRVDPAAILAHDALESGLPAELWNEANDLGDLPPVSGEAHDRVREALRREFVPPQHRVRLVGKADRLRHLCLCMCAQVLEPSAEDWDHVLWARWSRCEATWTRPSSSFGDLPAEALNTPRSHPALPSNGGGIDHATEARQHRAHRASLRGPGEVEAVLRTGVRGEVRGTGCGVEVRGDAGDELHQVEGAQRARGRAHEDDGGPAPAGAELHPLE